MPALREPIVLLLARMRRVLADETADLDDLREDSPLLASMLAIEGDRALDSELMNALRHLHRGDPAAAAAAAAGQPFEPMVLVLAAASDGAPAELAARALALPVAQLDPLAAPYLVPLAWRAGRDPAPYLAGLASSLEPYDRTAFAAFVEAVRAGAAPAAADAYLFAVDLQVRARAYALAAVALGDACPRAWRELARAALFAPERPYLRQLGA